MANRVLITGARAAAALDLARDFHAAGWEVHCADCRNVRMVQWSTLPIRFHLYAPPALDATGFQRDVKRLVEEVQPDLIVPVCEEVFHLAAPGLFGALKDILFAPDLGTLKLLHDKFAFASACHDWGLSAPESHLLTSTDALADYAEQPAEWVFKPPFSRFGESARIGLTSAEIFSLKPSPDSPLVAQRKVEGREVCLYAVAREGIVTAFAAYHSDWRLGGGASFAFTPLTDGLSRTLRELAGTIASNANITGQFSCDAIVDHRRVPHLIECNPRATSGLHLLAGDGSLARAISGGTEMPNTTLTDAYLGPAMALFGVPLALRSGRVAEWLAMMRSGSETLSRPGDRMPLLGAFFDAAGFAFSGLRHGISTLSATTRDIEWNGEELP